MYSGVVTIALAFGSKEGFDHAVKRVKAALKGAKDWSIKISELTETPQRRRRRS